MKMLKAVLLICAMLAAAAPAVAQVKQSREQMLFYTSEWKGERFPDGRPKVPDDLLKRVVDVSVEDLWDYLRDKGFNCQFDTGFQMLHPDKPFAGRALTAQYMPLRRDMVDAISAEGKREARVSGNNSWPIRTDDRRHVCRRRLRQDRGRHLDRLQPGLGHRHSFPYRLCLRRRHPRCGGKPR